MSAIAEEARQNSEAEGNRKATKSEAKERAVKAAGPFADEVEKLAALSPLEYDTIRKAKAKELNVRVTTLDAQVADMRKANTAQPDKASGPLFEEVTPWGAPIDGQSF